MSEWAPWILSVVVPVASYLIGYRQAQRHTLEAIRRRTASVQIPRGTFVGVAREEVRKGELVTLDMIEHDDVDARRVRARADTEPPKGAA